MSSLIIIIITKSNVQNKNTEEVLNMRTFHLTNYTTIKVWIEFFMNNYEEPKLIRFQQALVQTLMRKFKLNVHVMLNLFHNTWFSSILIILSHNLANKVMIIIEYLYCIYFSKNLVLSKFCKFLIKFALLSLNQLWRYS